MLWHIVNDKYEPRDVLVLKFKEIWWSHDLVLKIKFCRIIENIIDNDDTKGLKNVDGNRCGCSARLPSGEAFEQFLFETPVIAKCIRQSTSHKNPTPSPDTLLTKFYDS